MKNLKKQFHAILQGGHLVFDAARSEVVLLVLLNIISGFAPALLLWMSSAVIDNVTSNRMAEITFKAAISLLVKSNLLYFIITYLVLMILIDSLETVTGFTIDTLRDRVQGTINLKILQKLATIQSLVVFETPSLLSKIELSKRSLERLGRLASSMLSMITGVFAVIPSLLLAGFIAWWIPVVLFVSVVPLILVISKVEEQSWSVESLQADRLRDMQLYNDMLSSDLYAKEIKLLNLSEFLIDKWKNLYNAVFADMLGVRIKATVSVVSWSLLSGCGVVIPYVYVVAGALQGIYTLGDLALYAGLVFQVRRSIQLFVFNGADMLDISLGIQPIIDVLNLDDKIDLSKGKTDAPLAFGESFKIVFDQVSFSYPGVEEKILDDVSFIINPGETVALVGENGAGKSTIIKLLCRFYDTSSGSIIINDNRICNMEPLHLRKQISTVFQDFAKFPVTIEDNIKFGKISLIEGPVESTEIEEATKRVNLLNTVNGFLLGLQTPLTKKIEGGVDLSGGQWQRLAIARAMMRQKSAKLFLFDEPTSALDPTSEHEIFENLLAISKGKTTIIISHRLALTRFVDRILVFHKGKLVEQGTHEQLMSLSGVYCQMFSKQASRYVDG